MSMKAISTFSHSMLSLFGKCPQAYKFKYILNQKEAFSTIEILMGRCVHLALEVAYQAKKEGKEITAQMLVDEFDSAWMKAEMESFEVVRARMTARDYYQKGKDLLFSYFNRILCQDQSETICLEKRFKIPLTEDFSYQGVIDRVSRQPNGALRIIDYKTGKRVPDPSHDEQLASYSLWVFDEFNEDEIEVCYEDLNNDQTMVAKIARARTKAVVENINSKIADINRENRYEASPSILCKWCGYNPICEQAHCSVSFRWRQRFNPELKEKYVDPGTCPQCGSALKERTGKFGNFVGCTDFPACRYTRNGSLEDDF